MRIVAGQCGKCKEIVVSRRPGEFCRCNCDAVSFIDTCGSGTDLCRMGGECKVIYSGKLQNASVDIREKVSKMNQEDDEYIKSPEYKKNMVRLKKIYKNL